MDDIARDTYEKNLRKQCIENIEDPNYEDPPSYDQYQRERKEMLSAPEVSQEKCEPIEVQLDSTGDITIHNVYHRVE